MSDDRTQEFVRELTGNARRIYAFILSQMPNWADADEVFQETSAVLWEKFHQFESGTNFRAWAFSIARHKILQHHNARGRDVLSFSEPFLEVVHKEAATDRVPPNLRQEALAECCGKLNAGDRDLIERRYQPGATTKSVASAVGRSVDAVYKSLNRIHSSLLECITRVLRRNNAE